MAGVLILVFMGRWNKIDLCFEIWLCLFSIGCLLKLCSVAESKNHEVRLDKKILFTVLKV